jgi:glycosyltransferase involved in cell wall biosynthesis
MNERPRIRVGYLVSHPIFYQAPLLRLLSQHPEVDLTVLFISDFSTREYFDEGFGSAVRWNADLLSGYNSRFVGISKRRYSFWSPWPKSLLSELREGQFDCLWVHGYNHVAILIALARSTLIGVPVLFRGEGHRLAQMQTSLKRRLKNAIFRRVAREVSAFLAIGSMNRAYYEALGVESSRIFHVPYAVDNDAFQREAAKARVSRDEFRANLGLSADRPVILYVSKLQKRKRPMDLLSAYARLSPNGIDQPPADLIFVGEGEERSSLEKAIKALGWNSVHLLGFRNQDELPRFYDLCDVFVLPSEREPWGLVVNEVMNAGKPVICSSEVGAAYDLIEEDKNGFVYPVGDVAQLSQRIEFVLQSKARCEEMGAASLKKIAHWGYLQDVEGIVKAAMHVTNRTGRN